MSDMVKILAKTPGVKKEKKALQTRRDDQSQSMSTPINRIMFFQRTIGNQAVQKLIKSGTIQTKLRIDQPGDMYEQEADHIADQVICMAEPVPIGSVPATIQRKCTLCEDEKEKTVPTECASSLVAQRPSKGATTHLVALQGIEGQEEEYPPVSRAVIFRKAEFAMLRATAESASGILERLVRWQTAGEPLPDVTLQRMENSFGYDFSRVRIHRDTNAGEISRQLGALAFTHGSHIYFGHGMYDPGGLSGKRLLAHELTHVVQQGHATPQSEAATPAAVRASAPTIQRVATWGAGAVHEVNNLADSLLNGTPVGVTWPMLNGSTFWSTADARRLLVKPTLSFSSMVTGEIGAQVATVPANTGSFDETVLAAGPWTLNVPKATVGARFATLATCTGAGNSNFRAIGKPTDAAMFAANRRHEDRHAADHQVAFNGSIVPWDTKLTAAQTAGTSFKGPTEAAAETAIYAAMGGTPHQVADAFMNACSAAVVAYHSTPAGGGVTASNPTANADCSTSSVESTNPS